MVKQEVGSVAVDFEDKTKTQKLLIVTEENGYISINGKYIPASYTIEESIRFILSIPSELYFKVTYFKTEPYTHYDARYSFLHSWWECYAEAKQIVTASVLIRKMDYDSGYDSVS
jgi:hypothetical protein